MCQSPAPLGRRTGCLELLSTDLFWPPVLLKGTAALLDGLHERKGKSGRKLASADFVMITFQPLYHLGLLLLFSHPPVKKKSLFTKHTTCEIVITRFSIFLLDILVPESLSIWCPGDNYYYHILFMSTKLKIFDFFFFNRCTFIQGWMNGVP